MIGNAKRGWIGVDLGAGAVKLAQVVRRRGRLELADAAIVRRGGPGSSDATIPEAARSSTDEILGAMSLAQKARGRPAAGVLSMRDCEFHALYIKEPNPSPETVRRELSSSSPLSWSGRSFDSWSIYHPSDPKNQAVANVGSLSTQATTADSAAADIAGAGLDCQSLDGVPTAIARAMRLMVGGRDIPLAAVDLGYGCATYSAIRGGRPLYVRRLKKRGFQSNIGQLAEAIDCSEGEALGMLQQHGIASDSEATTDAAEAITSVVTPHLSRLETELRRTVAYLQSHRRNLSPVGMVLFGCGATTAGLPGVLSRSLDVDVRTWQPDPALLSVPSVLSVPPVLIAPAVAASALAWGDK